MNMSSLERVLVSTAEFYVARSNVGGLPRSKGLGYLSHAPSSAMISTSANAFQVRGPIENGEKGAGPKKERRVVRHNGHWIAKIDVPQSLMGLLIGARGATLRNIQESTGCRLTLPQRGQETPIEVKSRIGLENVQRCLNQIEEIVGHGKLSAKFTHFTALPCNHPDVVKSFNTFRDSILSSETVSPSVKDESLFTKSDRLHLTISMMWLLDDQNKKQAATVLEAAGKEIRATLGGAPVTADIWGVSIMNDDPQNAHVLYANVSGEGAQMTADIVYKHMEEAGLSPNSREGDSEHPVKMHMTLANSRYKAQKLKLKREPFDASAVLEEFQDFYFGKIVMDRVSICSLHSSSPHGFYEEIGSTPLF